MHPFRKDLIGQDIKDFRSADASACSTTWSAWPGSAAAWSHTQLEKGGEKGLFVKSAYAGMYQPWQWVVSQRRLHGGRCSIRRGVHRHHYRHRGGVVLIVLALSWLIGNRITLPLRQATNVAESIARGKLDSRIGEQALTSLAACWKAWPHAGTAARSDQRPREMATHHDAGNTATAWMRAPFPGENGLMVHETNTLVGAHVQPMSEVLSVCSATPG